MRVLLDESRPRRLRSELPEHEVSTVPEAGWAGAKNGELLRLAEPTFDVFVTMDQHLPEQQNLSELALCVVILRAKSSALRDLLPIADSLRSAVAEGKAGSVVILEA
jgi:hypothetical protein